MGRMIEHDRHCIGILDQLTAIQAAARLLSLELLEGHVRHSLADPEASNNGDTTIRELMDTLARAIAPKSVEQED